MPVYDLLPANLLLCLRPGANPDLLAAFDEETWADVLRQARHYNLAPLLYQRLVRERPELTLPPEAAAALRDAYYHTLAENSRRYNTLAQALTALGDAGIPVIFLKGAHLAEVIYGDIGLRSMGDFDLLVPRPNLPQALDALRKAGFEPEREYLEQVDGAIHKHAPPMVKDGVALEVHWSLTRPDGPLQPVTPDIAGIWQRAVPVTLQDGGQSALGLAPLDLLLHLCVHTAYSHAFHHHLYALCDIHEVLAVQGNGINWNDFLAAVDNWNARKGGYLALRLAVELLGAEVPPAVLAALEPPGFDPRALDWAQVQLFRRSPALSANFTRVMRKTAPGERLRALWTGLFPPPGVMTMIYDVPPRSWRLGYLYLYHPFTRLSSYRGHALALLKRDPQRVREADSSLNLLDWLGIEG